MINRPVRRQRWLLATVATLVVASAACGDDADTPEQTGGTTATTAAESAPAPSDGTETSAGEGAAPGGGVTCDTAAPGGNLERLCQADTLKIGTKFDQPLFGLKDPTSGEIAGFDVEIATLIAAALGKDASQIEFVETVSKVREDVIANGQVDFVVATYTINDDRKQKVDFAGPYYVAGQDLMVAAGDTSITGKDSLAGKKVCSVVGSTPEKRLNEETEAEVVSFEKYSECAEALADGRVDAVSTDNVILLGLIQESGGEFTLVGNPFSTEPYGIGLPLGDSELRGFINDVLEASYQNGSWAAAYEATVGAVDEKTPEPPAVDRY
jgi:glutamate transport system substrate-binding protein